MTLCAAVDCKNTGTHIFPKDVNRKKQWIKAIRRKNWKPSRYSRLCTAHFKPDDYHARNSYTGDENMHKVLKKAAVPSIFSFTKVEPSNPLAQQRSDRVLERSRKKRSFKTDCDDSIPGSSGIQTGNMCEGQFKDEQLSVQMEIELPIHPRVVLPENDQTCTSTESKSTQVNFEYSYGSIERHKDNDSVIVFYTGFETYAKFYFVFSTLSPMAHLIKFGSDVRNISIENQFFMTMIKLRQNKCNFELAQFFQISPTTVCNIFITWINYMDKLWKKLNLWPEKELVLYYVPDSFKQYDKNTIVIIDGTKIWTQKPGNADSVSDQQTVERSNFLKMCEPGDSILADRGYNIQDMFIKKDITLNISTFFKGKSQIPNLKLLNDRKLASQHVHIEHLMGLMKTYKIVTEELHHNFVPLASKIFYVCLMSCNFRECVMK